MNIRHIIITFLCFLLTGCLLYPVVSDIEFKARNHMEQAAANERSSDFQAAIKEYAIVSGMYPDTRYYKTAVWKSAVLNFHPDNPKIDYTAAHDWLQTYLSLPLSSEEKETAVLYAALIRKIEQNTDEKNKLLTLIEQQKRDKESLSQALKHSRKKAAQARNKLEKLSAYETELSILKDKLEKMKETELSVLKDKLKKMKEIDIQMHKTRKKSSAKSLESD